MSTPSLGHPTHVPADKARVVKGTPCSCSLVQSEGSFHLAVDTCTVDLVQGNAIAISYTWGEFDRTDICLGHRAGQPEEKIIMNLGAEWIFPDFLERLAALMADCGALWIDQLCIPQGDDPARAILAKIPVIYSTFDVVALLPGTLCKCLSRMLGDDLLQEHRSDMAESSLDDDAIRQCAVSCFNATGFSSWPNRIWTRQEFQYARRIRVVWNITRNLACVKRSLSIQTSELQYLNPYAHYLFDRTVAETSRGDLGLWALLDAHMESFGFMRTAVNEVFPHRNKNLTLARFLLGVPFKKHETVDAGGTFLLGLSRISTQSRKATQSRDYVLAIWPDCPGYIVPDKFRTMSLGELLEDAMTQLEDRHGITIGSFCPAGLFDPVASGQIRWKGSIYLHEKTIRDLRDVYGPLMHPCKAIPILQDGSVPLEFLTSHSRSIMNRAVPYENIFDESQTTEALDFMTGVMAQLPSHLQVRLLELASALSLDMNKQILRVLAKSNSEQNIEVGDTEFGECLFLYILSARNELAHGQDIGDIDVFGRVLPPLNHLDVVYRIVAYVLRMDLSLCRSRDLRLVATNRGSPCIGFVRSRLGTDVTTPELIALSEQQSPSHPHAGFLTVCLNLRFALDFGYGLLETYCDSTTPISPPRYHVVGVWCPTMAPIHEDIGAAPAKKDGTTDGFIW